MKLKSWIFLGMGFVLAGVCFPALLTNFECPSIIRQWVFVDIILMILIVPNIFYQMMMSKHHQVRQEISIIQCIYDKKAEIKKEVKMLEEQKKPEEDDETELKLDGKNIYKYSFYKFISKEENVTLVPELMLKCFLTIMVQAGIIFFYLNDTIE